MNLTSGQLEQQVTLYPHRDNNNDWRIVNATSDGDPYTNWMDHDVSYITSGTRVKIRHVQTEKSLHSHDVRPPVSDVDFQQEVSGYGIPGYAGDTNDDWIIEIYKGDNVMKNITSDIITPHAEPLVLDLANIEEGEGPLGEVNFEEWDDANEG